jgi:hypothetical protein
MGASMSFDFIDPIEPIRKTPWWIYLFGKPPYRQWVWEHVEGRASYGHWDYIRTPMLAYDDPEVWRETVRSLYDDLHFGPDNTFTGNRLAKRLTQISLVKTRSCASSNEAPHAYEPLTKPNICN